MILNRFEFNKSQVSNASGLSLKVQNWMIIDENGRSFCYTSVEFLEATTLLSCYLKDSNCISVCSLFTAL